MSSFGNQLSNGSESEKDMMIAQLHEEVSALKEILKDAIATKPATAQALHVQQQRAEELIESSPWLVFWVDARGFYREVNKQFCDFLHMSSQEVLDSKLGNLGEAPEFYDPIQSFIDSTKTSLTTEISMLINGVTNYFLLIMRKSETSDQSSVIGIDITARVILKNEKVRDQRLESVGTLAGGIAHDFNTILTVIQGNASIGLMSVDEEDEAFELFTEVENASKRAQKLTHQLLTFSKGGAPVISLSPLPILIEDAVQFTSRGSACKFDYNFEDGLCLGIIDCNQISQVIQNIAMNAIQAMSQKGTVSISASNISEGNSTYPMLDPGIFIEIKIEDTGIGIAAVDLPLIFDPYYSTNEGPGLGLAVAHSIVQKHGGHLLVESELGIGSCFRILLPGQISKEEKETKKEVANRNRQIMIMDDEDMIRGMLTLLLKRNKCDVTPACNGEEAIVAYKAAMETGNPIDLIIMDLTVPGAMGGKDCMEKILKIDPEAIAIVASGYSNDPVMADHSAYGFSGVLQKPYPIDDLLKEIDNLL